MTKPSDVSVEGLRNIAKWLKTAYDVPLRSQAVRTVNWAADEIERLEQELELARLPVEPAACPHSRLQVRGDGREECLDCGRVRQRTVNR